MWFLFHSVLCLFYDLNFVRLMTETALVRNGRCHDVPCVWWKLLINPMQRSAAKKASILTRVILLVSKWRYVSLRPNRTNMLLGCIVVMRQFWMDKHLLKKFFIFLFSGETYQNLISTTVVFMQRCQGNLQSHGRACLKSIFINRFILLKQFQKDRQSKLSESNEVIS